MAEVAPKTIQLPEDQCVAGLQCLQARGQARSRVMPPRREVFINSRGIDASSEQRIALGCQRLRPVSLGHPHISDEHRYPARKVIRYPAMCRWFPQRVFRSSECAEEAKSSTARKPVVFLAVRALHFPCPMITFEKEQSGTHLGKPSRGRWRRR